MALESSENFTSVVCSQSPGITIAASRGNEIKVWATFTGELLAAIDCNLLVAEPILSFDIDKTLLAVRCATKISVIDIICIKVLFEIGIQANSISFGHSTGDWALYIATAEGALMATAGSPFYLERLCDESQREACDFLTGSERVAAIIRPECLSIAKGGTPTITYAWPGSYTKAMTEDSCVAALCKGELHLFLTPSSPPLRCEADETGPLFLCQGRAWACLGLNVVTLP